jgi:RNA polymerase sigma factor (sigma-70 family)
MTEDDVYRYIDAVNRYIDELKRRLWTQLKRHAVQLHALDAELAVSDAFDALLGFLMDRLVFDAIPVASIDRPDSWLHTVVRRKVCIQHRVDKTELHHWRLIEHDPTRKKYEPSAEQEYCRRELARKIMEAIGGLPGRQRDVAELRLLHDYSYGEIAEELGIKVGAVKAHLSRAYEKLRRELGDLYDH